VTEHAGVEWAQTTSVRSYVDFLRTGEQLPDPLDAYSAVDRSRRNGACWVMANMVGGLDGSAAIGGRVADLSTPPDADLFVSMRALADVVLVGAETLRREGYGGLSLPAQRVAARRAAGLPAAPAFAVVTKSLNMDWSARPFADPAGHRALVITCEAADPKRVNRAREVADVIVAGRDRVDPVAAMVQLSARGHRVVLCEGGPTWLGEIVAADQLDELCLTVSPLMGGDPLPVSVSPPGGPLVRLTLMHVLAEGDTLFLRYERRRDGR
jgi:riboflavin biosynthesis pyrimidine reductase